MTFLKYFMGSSLTFMFDVCKFILHNHCFVSSLPWEAARQCMCHTFRRWQHFSISYKHVTLMGNESQNSYRIEVIIIQIITTVVVHNIEGA